MQQNPADLASHDPFSGSSIFSLFHHAVAATTPASAAAGDLKSFEDFVASTTASEATKELLEQAQAITKRHMNHANFNLDGQDGLMVPNGEVRPRNSRPAIGLKKARFSLIPEQSETSCYINPNFTTDGIDDPEEYFAVCEHLDAMKQKENISFDFMQFQKSLAERKPRPGIPGKTASAKYKHIFSDRDTSEGIATETDVSNKRNRSLPEDAYVKDHFHLSNDLLQDSQPKTNNIHEIPHRDAGVGSIIHDEKNLQDLFYNLSCHEDLGDKKTHAILKNLRIQPIDLGKIHLPGLRYSQKGSVSSTREMAADNASTDAVTDVERSSLTAKLRSSVSKSDKTISSLMSTWNSRKRISFRDSLEVILSPSSSPGEEVDFVEVSNIADKVQSPIQISDRKVHDASASGEPPKHILSEGLLQTKCPTHYLDMPSQRKSTKNIARDENPISLAIDDNITSNLMSIDASSRARDNQNRSVEKLAAGNMALSNESIMHSTSSLEKSGACESGRFNDRDSLPVCLDGSIENVGNDLQQNTPKSGQINLGLRVSLEEPVDSAELDADASPQEKHNCVDPFILNQEEIDGVQVEYGSNGGDDIGGISLDTSHTSESALPMECPESICFHLEENKELQSEPETLPKKRKKQKPMPALKNSRIQDADSDMHAHAKSRLPAKTVQRKLRSLSRRDSLAGAGTKMSAGLRRSTRIKSRPLEEWRGEKFLYGRIHDSLTTVIGIKYCSPGSKNFKVKSFVSEEYADMVDQAGKC